MMKSLVHIELTTHRVHVSQDDETGRIVCFKYDGSACDFESFNRDQEYDVADWIMKSIPILNYRVVILDDDSE
jgi:hypothetical protein